MDDNRKSWWEKLDRRLHPFDAVAYTNGDETFIRSRSAATEESASAKPEFIYSATYEMEGAAKPNVMKTKLERLLQGFEVREN